MLKTEVMKGMFSTTVLVKADTEEELDKFIQEFLRQYAPEGYGTSVKSKTLVKGDKWEATVHRWNSCE